MRIQAWQPLLFVECGDGWVVEEAWRRARRGYACGVDTSSALVARATEYRGVPGNLEFRTWDGVRLPCPSGFFQGVISTFALERSADPAGLFSEMRRVLRPGGEVYLLELDPAPPSMDKVARSLLAGLVGAGFHEARELTRWEAALDDAERAAAVILHARVAPPANIPMPIPAERRTA